MLSLKARPGVTGWTCQIAPMIWIDGVCQCQLARLEGNVLVNGISAVVHLGSKPEGLNDILLPHIYADVFPSLFSKMWWTGKINSSYKGNGHTSSTVHSSFMS